MFLELVLFVAVYSWGNILLGQVGEVDACMTPEYGEFELNYLAFGWSNYFHWFYSAEGQPCRFSGFGLCCVYFFSLPFYTLLKIYGAFKLPKTITLPFSIMEIIVYMSVYLWFLFYHTDFIITFQSVLNLALGMLWFLFYHTDFIITFQSVLNLALGMLRIFSALILYMLTLIYLCREIILTKPKGATK